MGLATRKLYIWLISLVAVLAIYLLYSQLSKTPKIDFDTAPEATDIVVDSNISEFDRSTGRIGDVGVGTVRKARYVRLNNEKQIEREFGFEKLLHEDGDEWELEKPYMNVYRPNFKCYISADKGKVLIEDTVGRPSPKDATLSENVVIHILPENSGSIKESFIYLDNVIFISEKSQFSTAGPVKFVSQDAQMLGRGLELIYNSDLDCLEFLRIIHLESLHLKTSSKSSLFATAQTQKPPQSFAAGEPQKASSIPASDKQTTKQQKEQYYRCVFSENVLIDCPEQVILADELSINNILWSRTSKTKSQKTDKSTETGNEHDTPQVKQDKSNGSPQEPANIVLTCDNGITVTPMDSPATSNISTKPSSIETLDDDSGRATFVAQKIDHCAVTEDTVASGPSEITFYAKDITGDDIKQTPAIVKVTAQKQAKFLPVSNQAIFEGKCLCTMLKAEANYQLKYTLSAPKLMVNLSRDKRTPDSSIDIEHLTASGGVVRLATLKTTEEKLLGGIELKCSKFDYDTGQQDFLATGPGLIKADNSNIQQPKEDLGRFSLRQQCYAIMQNFDTLKYSVQTNQVMADAEDEAIFINYFPIVQDQYGQQVTVTSQHIEALLYETPNGRTELSTLKAAGGFTYEEEADKTKKERKAKDIQFVGSEMFYDANKSTMTVHGDEFQPCYFNGALVDAIKYDLKTGKIKTKITAPGILRLNPR